MNKSRSAGQQLDSQLLYERQKVQRDQHQSKPAPTVVVSVLQTPENIGGIFRIADAAGCQQLILLDDEGQLQNSKSIYRTSRGVEKNLQYTVMKSADFVKSTSLEKPLIAIELTTESMNVFDTDLPAQCSFVVGNERHGIDQPVLDVCEQAVHIPMFGLNGSMNVSHALAIVLYEWRRQHV